MDGSAARSNDNGAALCPAFERRGAQGSTTFLGMTLPPPPPYPFQPDAGILPLSLLQEILPVLFPYETQYFYSEGQ